MVGKKKTSGIYIDLSLLPEAADLLLIKYIELIYINVLMFTLTTSRTSHILYKVAVSSLSLSLSFYFLFFCYEN